MKDRKPADEAEDRAAEMLEGESEALLDCLPDLDREAQVVAVAELVARWTELAEQVEAARSAVKSRVH